MHQKFFISLLAACLFLPLRAFSEPSAPTPETVAEAVVDSPIDSPLLPKNHTHPYLQQETSTIAEAEPSSFVNGSVNAISGTFYQSATDLIVPGPVPLNLRHYYNSDSFFCNWMGYAAMATNYNPFVQGLAPDCGHHLEIIAEEDGGSVVRYIAEHDNKSKSLGFYLAPEVIQKGFTNAGSGVISARTNLKNTRYHLYSHEILPNLDGKEAQWMAFLSDGSKRKYNSIHTFDQRIHLLWEQKPNKNLIRFRYGKNHEHDGTEGKLKRIVATDPSGKHASNWLQFNYSKSKHKARVTASNGKHAIYTFFQGDDGNKMHDKVQYVRKIISSDAVATYFNYTKIHNKHYINKVFHPHGRFLEIEYDHKGRVKEQKAPAGKDGDKKTIYSFEYKPDEHHTNVWNAHNILTVYRYSWKKRLKGIESHLDKEFYRGIYFYWGEKDHIERGKRDTSDEGNLLGKSLQNKEGRALASWSAKYDDYGNILEESFYGSLTGKRPEDFAVSHKDGTPLNAHVECYRKYYTYSKDHLHLKISESEDDGPTIKYAYKEGTDLLTAKFICKGDSIKIREFFSYDNEGILIKHSIDDGCSHDPDNLKEVTERRITRITPNGRRCEYGVGQPETVKEYYLDVETGKEVKLSQKDYRYTKAGLVSQEELRDADDHLVATTYFEYDHKGNLTKKTDPLGRVWAFEYDTNYNKTREELLKSGSYTTYTYDLMNRLTAEKEHHADKTFTTHHEYDSVGNRVSTTDHYGNTTNFEYDDLNRLVKTIYPAMHDAEKEKIHPTETQRYDEQDCVVKHTDANGNSTRYTYTSRKQPLTITHPDDSKEQFQYFLNGKLDHKWDQNGTKTSYEYDFLGRVTEVKIYDSHDHKLATTSNTYNAFHLLSSTDAMGNTTYYSYDGAGRTIKEVKKEGDNFAKTTYEYDALGRLTTTQKWYDKDSHDYVAAFVKYDAMDRVISEWQEDGSGELLSKVCYEYDTNDNRTKVTTSITKEKNAVTRVEYNTHDLPEVIIDEIGNKTKIKYNFDHSNFHDQRVLQITTTDPLGNSTIEVQDVFGQRKIVERHNHKDKLLSRSHYFYDAVGNITREQHAAVIDGEEDHDYVITKEYDAMDRMTKLTEQPERAHQKVTEYSYYASGCLKTITKPDGIKIYHTYDALLRLESMKSSDKSIHYSYEYDLNNNPIVIKDEVADTTNRRSYDAWSRLTKETLSNKLKVTYEYDPLGRLTEFGLPNGSSVKYAYQKGHLSEVIRKSKNHKTLYQHRYNDVDLREQILKSTLIKNAGTVEYVYDRKGRTRKINAPKWKLLIPSGGFDDVGNLRKLHFRDRVGHVQGYFDYDDLYQLIKEEGAHKHSFEHDSLSNCLKKDGDRQKVDHLNKLVESKDADFEYDKNGNLIKAREDKKTTRYRYDALNRLVEACEEGEFRARYSYDSFHRRTSKTIERWEHKHWKKESEVRFLYLYEREVGAVDHHDKIIEFRSIGRGKGAEIGASVGIEIGKRCYAPVHDHRGNICSLIGAKSGKVREVARYSAFGEMKLFTGAGKRVEHSPVGNPWHFVSKRLDPETGFVYFGKRYYSPAMGRWITPDPIGFSDGPNLYAYVHNSPLMLLDPYGLFSCGDAWDALAGFASGVWESSYTVKGAAAMSPIGSIQGVYEHNEQDKPDLSQSESWARGHSIGKNVGVGIDVAVISAALIYISGGTAAPAVGAAGTAVLAETVAVAEVGVGSVVAVEGALVVAEGAAVAGTTVGTGVAAGAVGLGVLKIGGKLLQGAQKVAKASKVLKNTKQLNTFHKAAKNLSKTGQRNIRTLRGWAKSKGWVKQPNPLGKPEKWGTHVNGTFHWNLAIKPEASFRGGLQAGSNIPRFDARLWLGGNNYIYLNPFTGEMGSYATCSHIPLELPIP